RPSTASPRGGPRWSSPTPSPTRSAATRSSSSTAVASSSTVGRRTSWRGPARGSRSSTRSGTAGSPSSPTPTPPRRVMLDVVSADTRLVATDPGIPGLRDVLSPLGLVRRLAPAWDVADARVVYLRYKPATSLVAGLRLTAADGATSFVQALALGVGAPEKLAKVVRAGDGDDVGRGAVVDPRLGVALSDVTADRHL